MGGGDMVSIIKGPKEAYLSLAEKGSVTAQETSLKVFGQSFYAGCYIGFGALLATIIAGSMPGAIDGVDGTPGVVEPTDVAGNPGLQSLLFAFLFPVNLVLILLTGGILFTGTSAACPAAIYEGKASVKNVARCLFLSWWGNVLGSMLFALFTVWCGLNEGKKGLDGVGMTKKYLKAIAIKKTKARFDVTLAKGIGCNWMVCMAVFLQGQAQDMFGKVVGIYLPISTFVMIGFEHIPANFYLLEVAMLNGDISFADVLLKNWIPVTIGNFIAGAFIVAGGYSFFFGRLGSNQLVGSSTYFSASARKSLGYNVPMPDVEAADAEAKEAGGAEAADPAQGS